MRLDWGSRLLDHRWLRCDAQGDACTPIAGAAGSAYVLTEADAYHRMRVEVTAANGSGAATARSPAGALVADAAGATASSSDGGQGDQQGDGQSRGEGGGKGAPGSGGIDGLANPLAQLPGHVPNGAAASTRARGSPK